jgi:DNA-binding PadR family transcriptional regulator
MTNAEFTILSLIAEQPRHGYDIEQVIEARGIRDWTEIGFSSIYYLLNKLEKVGLIEGQPGKPDGGGPARKVYYITEEGRDAHTDRTIVALSMPQTSSSSFLLGLSNCPVLSKEQFLAALNLYVRQLRDRRETILKKREDQRPLPRYVEAMFEYSQVLADAELNWIQGFIKEMEVDDGEN